MIDEVPDITQPKTFAVYAVLMVIFGTIVGIGFHITFANIMVPQPCQNETLIRNTSFLITYPTSSICYAPISFVQGIYIVLILICTGTLIAILFHKIPDIVKILTGQEEKDDEDE